MKRLIEPLLWGVAAAALLYGAYAVGKHAERKWWRTEIAAKSSRVQAILARSGAEADDTDQKLIAALGDAQDELTRAESALADELGRKPEDAPEPPAAMSVDEPPVAPTVDPCRPVPARCLRASR